MKEKNTRRSMRPRSIYKKIVKLLLLSSCLIIVSTISNMAFGQSVERNVNGELVVKYDDGTWRHFLPSDSSMLKAALVQFAIKEKESPAVQKDTIAVVVEDLIPERRKKKRPLNKAVSLSQLRKELNQLESREVKLRHKLGMSVDSSSLYTGDQLIEIKSELALITNRKIFINEQLGDENKPIATNEPDRKKTKIPKQVKRQKVVDNEVDQKTIVSTYDFELNDVPDRMERPPEMTCQLQLVVDPLTAIQSKRTQAAYFFQHTPDEIRTYVKDKHYLSAFASMKESNGNMQLQLIIDIDSKKAKDAYGYIERNGMLKIKLINGQTVNLTALTSDGGKKLSGTNLYRYVANYAVSKESTKLLQRFEVDLIRMSWSVGYEDYEVLNMDLLQNQINCLKGNL